MVELAAVAFDDPRLERLVQLYIHEWSGLLPVPIGDDARYVYADLRLYAGGDDRGAYLLLAANRRTPLGFALARRDAGATWHLEEFFILAGARRRGAGGTAARRVFAEHPGPWTLTVRPENPSALAFWRATLPGADERVEVGQDGVARRRLSFIAPSTGGPSRVT